MRESLKRKNVYLMRIEQLYPFPKRPLMKELARFPNAEIYWCQEEPQNMGAWWFVLLSRKYQDYKLHAIRAAWPHEIKMIEDGTIEEDVHESIPEKWHDLKPSLSPEPEEWK